MSLPSIVLCHGGSHPPVFVAPLAQYLQQLGYDVHTPALPCAAPVPGGKSTGLPGLKDDIAAARKAIQALVDEGKEVVVWGHSNGSLSGGASIQGLTVKDTQKAGKKGGVRGFIIASGTMIPAGISIKGAYGYPPDEAYEGDLYTVPEQFKIHGLYDDFPQELKDHYFPLITHNTRGFFTGENTYCPTTADLPITWIFAEGDKTITPEMQEMQIKSLGEGVNVVRVQGGHMVYLLKGKEHADIIDTAVRGMK